MITDLVNAVGTQRRKVKDIILQAKIIKVQGAKKVDSTTAFETYQRETGKAGDTGVSDWSPAQQSQLEVALKTTPASDQR